MATDISELERDAIDDGVKVSRLLRHTGPSGPSQAVRKEVNTTMNAQI
jgi:hypothetical protein